ncbi:MAG: leucine-rich repeat protein [Firmicutes bacterium]|nr:leucine-rich repeat protein [Candidatus Colimorpha enterica]
MLRYIKYGFLCFLAVLLAVVLPLLTSAAVYCDGITYEIKEGIMYFSGSGNIVKTDSEGFLSALETVEGAEIGDGISYIPSDFLLCGNLKYVYISPDVSSIGDHAVGYDFAEEVYTPVSGFTVKGENGSAAEVYAEANGFSFVEDSRSPEVNTVGGDVTGTITWSLDKSGILSIEGTGKIPDYTSDKSVPWFDYYSENNGYHISSLKIGNGITSIGSHAFGFYNDIEVVVFPDSLLEIGKESFVGCARLSDINLSNVEIIGENAFGGLSSLTSVSGDKVHVIGKGAFSGSGLVSVSFSGLLTELFESTFFDCQKLERITAPGVGVIGHRCFYNCRSLNYTSFSGNLTTIGSYAFNGCESLESFEFRSSLVSLGEFAFSCSGIRNLIFNSGFNAVPEGAFENCGKLSSVQLGNNITTISERAFASCGALEKITLSDRIQYIAPYSLGYYYINDVLLQDSYSKYSAFDFTIYGPEPSVVKNYAEENGFVFISTGFISSASGNINESVTWKIDTTTGLLKVKGSGSLPDYASPSETPWYLYKEYITSASFEGVKNVPSCSFTDYAGFDLINLSSSVTSIGDFAFSNTAIGNLTLPKNLTDIGESAFENCSNITQLSFPTSLDNIGENAFRGLDGLTSVYIPESVSFIGDRAIGYDENGFPLSGFLIKGAAETPAQYYADENGITYRIDGYITVRDEQSGAYIVMLGVDDDYTFSQGYVGETLEPEVFISHSDYLYHYLPSLSLNGASASIDGIATIYLPVSNSQNQLFSKVFIRNGEGDYEQVEVEARDGCFVINVSSLTDIVITNAMIDDLVTISVDYLDDSGEQLFDAKTYYATRNADYNISPVEINGFKPDKDSLSGRIDGESDSVSLTFVYKQFVETTEQGTDTEPGNNENNGSSLSYLIIIEIILILILVITSVLLVFLLIRRRNILKAIEKSEQMIAESEKTNKFADTMVADVRELDNVNIDIASLFAEEELVRNYKSDIKKNVVKKHFSNGKKPNPRRKV